jgi:serine/threonine protein phosphatase PrpC
MGEAEQQVGSAPARRPAPAGPVWASLSARGGRENNQDRCGDGPAGSGRAFVVADGLGGHAAGEVAAETGVAALLEALRAGPAPSREALEAGFEAAQRAVQEVQLRRPESAGCRTTAVVLVLADGRALWGHVGDTRLYHLRRGRVAHQTLDHSVPQALVEAGAIASSEIRRHPDRNRLLRSLGGEGAAEPTIAPAPVEVEAGDAFLLCSDGFWEHVTEAEMEASLAQAADPAGWLRALETRVLAQARGAFDNYTATAVFVSPVRRAGRARAAWLLLALALLAVLGAAAGLARCAAGQRPVLVFGARAPAGGLPVAEARGAAPGWRLHFSPATLRPPG